MPLSFLDRWYLSLFGPVIVTSAAALVHLLPWLVTTQYYFRAKHFANRIWLWLTDERTGPLRPARLGLIARARAAAITRLAAIRHRAEAAVRESAAAQRARAAAEAAAVAAAARIKDSKAFSSLAATAVEAAAAAEKDAAIEDNSDGSDSAGSFRGRRDRQRQQRASEVQSDRKHSTLGEPNSDDSSESGSPSCTGSSISGSDSDSSLNRSQKLDSSVPDAAEKMIPVPASQGAKQRADPAECGVSEPSRGVEISSATAASGNEPVADHLTATAATSAESSPLESLEHASQVVKGPAKGHTSAERPIGPGDGTGRDYEQANDCTSAIKKEVDGAEEVSDHAQITKIQSQVEPGLEKKRKKHRQHRRRDLDDQRRRAKVAFEAPTDDDGHQGEEEEKIDGEEQEDQSVKAKSTIEAGGRMSGRKKRRKTTWGAAAAHFRSQCLDSAVSFLGSQIEFSDFREFSFHSYMEVE